MFFAALLERKLQSVLENIASPKMEKVARPGWYKPPAALT